MQRLFIRIAIAIGIIAASGAYAQQPAQNQQPSKELVQYVRDARKAGLKDGQIQQNAVNAGWPADQVGSALQMAQTAPPAGAKEGDQSQPAASAAGSVTSSPMVAESPVKSHEVAPPTSVEEIAKPNPAEAGKNEAAAAPAKAGETAAAAPAGATPAAKLPDATGTVKPPVDRGVPDDYEIGAGDELQISVWKEPDASVPGVVVRPDGKISMPLLKEVSVVGLTPTQAEKAITQQLVQFISAADVTVIVKAINSKKIYVVGGVKKEGPIPFNYRMTIMQAISEAGGLTDYAKKKKIYVLRHENGRDYQLRFDYDAALRGEKMELNIPLMAGDTLVVPK